MMEVTSEHSSSSPINKTLDRAPYLLYQFCKTVAVYRTAPQQQSGQAVAGVGQVILFFENASGDAELLSFTPEFKPSSSPSEFSSDGYLVVTNYISHECHSHGPWIAGETSRQFFVSACSCQVLRQTV